MNIPNNWYTIEGCIESKIITKSVENHENGSNEYYDYSATINKHSICLKESDFDLIKTGDKVIVYMEYYNKTAIRISIISSFKNNLNLSKTSIESAIERTEVNFLRKTIFKLLSKKTLYFILTYLLSVITIFPITIIYHFLKLLNVETISPFIALLIISSFIFFLRFRFIIKIVKDIKFKKKTVRSAVVIDKIIHISSKRKNFQLITDSSSYFLSETEFYHAKQGIIVEEHIANESSIILKRKFRH